ncbi:MAG: outer membrane protein assembly factor BamD [Pseudomonadales bacterium]|nr:outer membrane protein assembly factor BamD [Pseudomonadales bacterium]
MQAKIISSIFIASLLVACAGHKKHDDELSDKTYYEQAMMAISDHSYQTAIHKLEDLDSHYPVGPYAEQGQLELIYANMMHLDYGAASAAADRFIHLHPSSSQLDYAYYVKGIADFKSDEGAFDRYLPIHSAWRDIGERRTSFDDFKQLIDKFPDSRFIPDARQHMIYIRNQLAEGELHVAMYYARRGAYLAAVNRARNIVEGYSGAPSTTQALAVMSYCYDRLDLKTLADTSLQVLRYNDPSFKDFDSKGRVKLDFGSRNDRRSWLNIISFGLLGNSDVSDPM